MQQTLKISRRTFITRTAALAALSGLEHSREDAASGALPPYVAGESTFDIAPVTLHGYGTISAVIRGP